MSSIRKSSRTRGTDASQPSVAKSSSKKQLFDECMYPRTGRRGAPQVFPRKLFQILEEVEDDVISWTNSQGTSFIIHDMDYFTENVLLNYFRHQKYSSFQRQLNLYGFHKICKGPETGAYAHDCFVKDKPQLLMGVRRLPQRVAAAVSKAASASKGHKIVIKKQSAALAKSKPSAFARLTACITPRSQRTHESSSDADSYDSEEESDFEGAAVNVPEPPMFRDVIENSVDSVAEVDEMNHLEIFGLLPTEGYELEGLEQDGIVRIQPLPKECILDSSARVVDGISEGVNQMALERSPIAVAKTVKIPESSRSWSVAKVPMSKPMSPNSSLQIPMLIPKLARGTSSAFVFGKSSDEETKAPMDVLQDIEKSEFTRSKTSSVDLMSPPALNQRLTSEAWNIETIATDQELQQLFFFDGKIENIFMRQQSCDMIAPPKPIEMER
jgi:hypothetical protein